MFAWLEDIGTMAFARVFATPAIAERRFKPNKTDDSDPAKKRDRLALILSGQPQRARRQ